jgi:predicted Kef-type K+ transport protein
MLSLARILGSFARKLHHPAVLGEIIGGIILGPTVFGALAPALQLMVFPPSSDSSLLLIALATTVICSIGLPWLMKTHPISAKAWEPLPLHEQAGSYNYLES